MKMISKITNVSPKNKMQAVQNKANPSFGRGYYFIEKSNKRPLGHYQELDILIDTLQRVVNGGFKFLRSEQDGKVISSPFGDEIIIKKATQTTPSSMEFYPKRDDIISGLNVEIVQEGMSDSVNGKYQALFDALDAIK